MLTESQIESYFARIHVTLSNLNPSLENLSLIHSHQVQHIDVTNKQMHQAASSSDNAPISLEISDIYDKLVKQASHGYCYENNLLVYAVLKTLGYDAQLVEARIHRTAGLSPIAQHAFMLVNIDDKTYMVDAGYGGEVPIPILKLKANKEQQGLQTWYTTCDQGNRYKFMCESNHWTLHSLNNEQRIAKPLYEFIHQQVSIEHELAKGNHSVCKDMTTSPFKNRLFITHFTENSRIGLTQDEFTIREMGKLIYTKPMASLEQFAKYSKKYFSDEPLGSIMPRVAFGQNTPQECLTWYQDYKKSKKLEGHENIIEAKQRHLKKFRP